MMSRKPLSWLQKTHDECYLICSTAVYYETQGNEAEALRSWRSALDQIYYHNAYRVPSTFVLVSDTEKTLQSNLRDIEIRCKERIDFYEALQQPQKNNLTKKNTPNSMESIHTTAIQIQKADTKKDGHRNLNGNRYSASPTITPKTKTVSPLLHNVAMNNTSSPATQSHQASSRNVSVRKIPPDSSITTGDTLGPDVKRKLRHTLRPNIKNERNTTLRRRQNDESPVTSLAASLAWQLVGKTKNEFRRHDIDKTSPAPQISSNQNKSNKKFQPKSDSSSSNIQLDNKPQSLDYNSRMDQRIKTPFTASSRPNGSRSQSHGDFFQSKTSELPDSIIQGSKNSFLPLTHRTKASVPRSAGSLSQLDRLTSSRKNESSLGLNHSSRSRNQSETPVRRKPKNLGYSELENNIAEGSNKALPSRNTSPSRNRNSFPEKCDNQKDREKFTQNEQLKMTSRSCNDDSDSCGSMEKLEAKQEKKDKRKQTLTDQLVIEPNSLDEELTSSAKVDWEGKVKHLIKNLPKGVHESAAKQVLDEVVVKGDEVHWDDVSGLHLAKEALKEAVVYPFLRPDLFMGLREPARGMLLFGPPGTGKTMLARAVATESKSTFFSISASSLTSKYLGESEKLVRALFQLAKLLAPSIIFVDEIDSLLSARSGSGEHESTRRIKTEFFIQWSDLQRAAAGRAQGEKEKERGDATRVLVLAATNLPWAIDEAARRRFVRRQYIPLPEGNTRAVQLKNLLSHQKHSLNEDDIQNLVDLTDGFSGSDITALAKDAAMGPLRSLGEAMLFISMDEIRPIQFTDFEASLTSIRPSVSKESLKEFEDWARVFGERGG